MLLGIADRGASIPIDSAKASSDIFLTYFSNKKEATRSRIEELLKFYGNCYEEEDDVLLFCKFYILYIFVCVLFSSSTYKVPLSLIDIVDDFENLDRFNWVEAIHEFMAPQLPKIGDIFSSTETKHANTNLPYLKGFAGLLAVSV